MSDSLARTLAALVVAAAVVLPALACAGEPRQAPPDGSSGIASGHAADTVAATSSKASVTGIAAPASGGFPSVVVLEPEHAAPAAVAAVSRDGAARAESGARDAEAGAGAPASGLLFMDQIGSAFYPPTVVARVGQPVEFLNSEGVMHNVHVADETDATVFNLATPPGFDSYEHAFAAPGVYRVTCDIHPSMKAFIVIVSSPWAVVAKPDGSFSLPDVPPGSYQASVWSVDASRRVERTVEIGSGTVELDLAPR